MSTKFLTYSKQFIKAALRHVLFFIDSNPKFRRYVLVVVHRFGLYGTARAFYAFLADFKYRSSTKNATGFIPSDIKYLPPHARQVYVDLNAAIECCKSEKNN